MSVLPYLDASNSGVSPVGKRQKHNWVSTAQQAVTGKKHVSKQTKKATEGVNCVYGGEGVCLNSGSGSC